MSTDISEDIAAMIVERARTRESAWAAKQAEKKRFRAERKKARDAGLVERYARKAAHIKRSGSIA
jgi:hypothetical protein